MDDTAAFRERIRHSLRGSFQTQAEDKDLRSFKEAEPLGQGQDPNAQKTSQTPSGSGVNKANVAKTMKTLFITLGNVIKVNNSMGAGISIGLKDSEIQELADRVADATVKGDVRAFQTTITTGTNVINKKILDFAQKQQAAQKNSQPSTPESGTAKTLEAEVTPGDNMQALGVTDDGTVPPGTSSDMAGFEENENPVSVKAMQGILKFATPSQVGDAIKAMDSDKFAQFASGLQKDALDVLSASINNNGGGAEKPDQGHGGGNNNEEGNLKLGDL